MFGSLGATEIILICLLVLLIFGGKKIPEMMRGLGTGMREFKKATNIDDDEPTPRKTERLDEPRERQERPAEAYSEPRRIEEHRIEQRRIEERGEERAAEERRLDGRND